MRPNHRLLSLALLLWSTGYNMALPFLPLLAAGRGADPRQVGLLQGAAYAGAALALIPAGWLAERAGRRKTLIAFWSVGAVGMLLLLRPGGWEALFPGAALALVGAGAIPALAALVAQSESARGEARLLNGVFAAAPAGLMLGSTVAGWLSQRLGLEAAFAAAALVTLGAVLILFRVREEAPPRPAVHPDAAPATESAGLRSAMGRLLLLSLPAGVLFLLLSLPAGFMTPYLREVGGLSLFRTGITNAQLAVGQLGWSLLLTFWPRQNPTVTLGLGPLGSLTLRSGTLLAMGVCLVANALFGLLFPLGGTATTLLALLLRGALFSLQPLGMALVSEVTGKGGGLTARFSLLALVMGGATALAPVISGHLYAALPALPFYAAGLAAAAGATAIFGIYLLALRPGVPLTLGRTGRT